MGSYLGSWKIDDVLTLRAQTHSAATLEPTDADSAPAYRVYEDNAGTPILTGTFSTLDASNTDGFYVVQITLSAANGFDKGKCYAVRKFAVVGGTDGADIDTFQIEAEVDSNSVSNIGAGVVTATAIASGALTSAKFDSTARDFINPSVLQMTTIATVNSQTSFTLTAGSSDDDAYNGNVCVFVDAVTAGQKSHSLCSDYTGTTKTVVLSAAPKFTIAVGDTVALWAFPVLATQSEIADTVQARNRIRKNVALDNFPFVMIDSADDISGKTGVTVTAQRSIDGGAFAACSNSPTEVGNGAYKINLSAADLNGNVIIFYATGTGCNATTITIITID